MHVHVLKTTLACPELLSHCVLFVQFYTRQLEAAADESSLWLRFMTSHFFNVLFIKLPMSGT